MSILAINGMILNAGRLSGIGHYIVQLATNFARFNRESESFERILVLCNEGALHHFAGIEGIEFIPLRAKGGRISRVLVEQLYLPWILRHVDVTAFFNPSFTGPMWGVGAIVTTVMAAACAFMLRRRKQARGPAKMP